MFSIDNQSRKAVYEQIVEQTERFVLSGLLAENQPMPSVRSLSIKLSVNPNTIQKAYAVLEGRGITYITPGKGSFISPKAKLALAADRLEGIVEIEARARECAWAGIDKSVVYKAVDRGYANNGGNLDDKS